MGIKYFFSWLRKNFDDNVKNVKNSYQLPEIDVLMFDMNGIFHNVCAEVYEYGPYKKSHLLQKPINKKHIQLKVFQKVCEHIDFMINFICPKEKILLCIDGVAPQSKQNQQRSRRFKSAKEKSDEEFMKFDSNCISPGTEFMEYLGKYIDYHIHKSVGNNWNFEVYFSNDKVPGEAEHKLIDYTRKLNEQDKKKSYMVYGMDADLIMLTLGTMLESVYIIRENTFSSEKAYYLIEISEIRRHLFNIMNWNDDEYECDENELEIPKHFYNYENAIYDFIAMCFTVGNDFLPQIPTIEIYEGGIEIMFDSYKTVCKEYGHLTKITDDGVIFNKNTLKKFFEYMKDLEKGILEQKLSKREMFFQDENLERYAEIKDGIYNLNFPRYLRNYNENKIKSTKQACLKYLEGMQWVLTYYIEGCKEWNWTYQFHYAPHISDLYQYIDEFNISFSKIKSSPCQPFFQLVRIMPSKSKNLIPRSLHSIFDGDLKDSFPQEFEIDIKGKKKEWEGIALIPFLNDRELLSQYNRCIREITEQEKKRNMFGKVFIYKPTEILKTYSSYYGNFETNCERLFGN
jgi:5'-3' exonuclease